MNTTLILQMLLLLIIIVLVVVGITLIIKKNLGAKDRSSNDHPTNW